MLLSVNKMALMMIRFELYRVTSSIGLNKIQYSFKIELNWFIFFARKQAKCWLQVSISLN